MVCNLSGLSGGRPTIAHLRRLFFAGLLASALSPLAEGQPLPVLSINDVSALEGNSGASTYTFTVMLSAASASTVTVAYATQDGAATGESDYTATSGSLTFTPGQTSLTVAVSVNGDTTVESNEAFYVGLSSSTNATIRRAIGQGTILSDDPAQAQGVVAGHRHSCAITTAGGVKCWGRGSEGQVGNGTTSESITSPATVIGVSAGVTQIAAGGGHTCAIGTGSEVLCWGANLPSGQGFPTRSSTAVNVVGLGSGVKMIAAGLEHTCVVTAAGGARCWGQNGSFQLGNDSNSSFSDPVDAVGLTSGVKAVAAGWQHSCALLLGGGVKCWGAGMGVGATLGSGPYRTPVDVAGLSGPVSAIAAGAGFTCALMADGSVQCWGDNGSGQLGNGTVVSRNSPASVVGLNAPATSITAGGYHACATTTNGDVKCWGDNSYGQLGNGTGVMSASPITVPSLANANASVTAGGFHTCAALTTGAVKCWGGNYYGAVGDGTAAGATTSVRLTPVNVTGLNWSPNRPQPAWHGFFAVDTLETPMVGDFDGDGRTDIITFTRQNPNAFGDVFVSLSTGTRFGANDVSAKWHDFFAINTDETVVIGDFNGDGKDDMATRLGNNPIYAYVALSTGAGMTSATVWTSGLSSSGSKTDFLGAGDANGDGKADLILFDRGRGVVNVSLSDGTKFAAQQEWHTFFAVSPYERPRVADVNGDGKADIVTFATDSPTAFGDVYVALSNGTGFRAADGSMNSDKWHDFFAIRPTEQILIGDLNGDGKDDFFTFLPPPFGQAYTVLSRGTSMAPNVLWPEVIAPALGAGDTVFVGDVNGDGKADIIIFDQKEGKVYVALAS